MKVKSEGLLDRRFCRAIESREVAAQRGTEAHEILRTLSKGPSDALTTIDGAAVLKRAEAK